MINIKLTTTSALAAALVASAAMADNAITARDNTVVKDARGNFVTSIVSGNCVRTDWEAPNNRNICAPPDKYVSVIKSPARQLRAADKVIFFDFDSAKLDMRDKNRLDNLASVLGDSKDIQDVKIVGFADKIGSKEYNVDLSKERAVSVQNYLASQGYINTSLAQVRGLGETTAYANCQDNKATGKLIECLAPDRRVEVEIEFIEKKPLQAYFYKIEPNTQQAF